MHFSALAKEYEQVLAVVVWIDPVYCPVHLPSEEFFRRD
jgi:hypothetical protein